MEYLKDSLDTGQIEDGFSTSKSMKGYRSSYCLPGYDPEQHQSSYNLLTQWDPGEKLLQPPLFRKESTSELIAKTKGSDRILTIKLGLSPTLMVQEGKYNPNVTLKGLPKESLRFVWSESSHNTTNHTISPPKGGLSLTLMSEGQIYSPKCNPKRLPTKTLEFVGMVSHTAHATQQKFLIGSFS